MHKGVTLWVSDSSTRCLADDTSYATARRVLSTNTLLDMPDGQGHTGSRGSEAEGIVEGFSRFLRILDVAPELTKVMEDEQSHFVDAFVHADVVVCHMTTAPHVEDSDSDTEYVFSSCALQGRCRGHHTRVCCGCLQSVASREQPSLPPRSPQQHRRR